jgi:hypothetical protein
LGEGSQGHEILHHAAKLELVLDRIHVVQTSLLKDHLKVVYGQSCLMLVIACGSHDTHHARATRLLAIATTVVSRFCGLLKMLLVPLHLTVGTLLGILIGDIRRCLYTIAQG